MEAEKNLTRVPKMENSLATIVAIHNYDEAEANLPKVLQSQAKHYKPNREFLNLC